MKKNYIAPNTEMTQFAANGIMQDALNIVTGSGTSFDQSSEID